MLELHEGSVQRLEKVHEKKDGGNPMKPIYTPKGAAKEYGDYATTAKQSEDA